MKKYDVVVPRNYDKNGEEKTAWGNVGTLTYFEPRENRDGGFILELHMFPTTPFKVFERKPKDEIQTEPQGLQPGYNEEPAVEEGEKTPDDGVDNIPW